MQGPPGGDPNGAGANGNGNGLPPINVSGARPGQSLLTPITERSVIPTRENTLDGHFENSSSPEAELQRHISSVMSHSPMQGSPSMTAAASVVNGMPGRQSPAVGSSGGSIGGGGINAVAPTEPPQPTRPSQSFEQQLPPIPASNITTPQSTTPNGALQQQNGTSRPANGTPNPSGGVNGAAANVDMSGQLSPRSFAESLWKDAAAQLSPQQTQTTLSGQPPVGSPEPFSASSTLASNYSPTGPLPPPARNMSSSSLERPPSLNNVPRSQSPLRSHSYTAQQASQPPVNGQQRITSPLATSQVLPAPAAPLPMIPQYQPQGSPEAGPSHRSGDDLPGYGNAGTSHYPQDKKAIDDAEEAAAQMSPASHYSYPASAQMQNPDLLEPQPKPSRSSHTVLNNAPFMV